jgi:hypothetical protein
VGQVYLPYVNYMNQELIKQWCLEALRLGAFAAFTAIVNFLGSLATDGKIPLSPEWILVFTSALKALDRAIHEDPHTDAKGILPF